MLRNAIDEKARISKRALAVVDELSIYRHRHPVERRELLATLHRAEQAIRDLVEVSR